MAIIDKILRAGEGKILRKLERHRRAGQRHRGRLRGDDRRRAAGADRRVPASGSPTGRPSTTCCPRRSPTVREAAKRTLGQRHYDVQIMGGAALHLGNIAEMKTGEGKTLVVDAAGLPQRADRRGRARRHRQRLPRQARRRVDGPRPPLPRPRGRRDPVADDPAGAPRRVRRRHHLRHQQRVRLRLPARQHGVVEGGAGPARPQLRDRRRGRLDPDRRGPHAADHLRARPTRPTSGTPSSPSSRRAAAHATSTTRSTRRSAPSASSRRASSRIEDWLGIDNLYEPVEHPAGRLPEQRDQGQGAVQARQGLRRHERRGPDRRRAHRPHPARAPLQRGPAPGDRGQGGRGDQGREPDPGHDHPAELLPALREARPA